MMAYYVKDNHLIKHVIISVTDDYRKDTHGVEAFLKILVDKVQKEVPSLRELHIWMDGCSAQYKGKVAFWYLAKRNLETTHNLFLKQAMANQSVMAWEQQ